MTGDVFWNAPKRPRLLGKKGNTAKQAKGKSVEGSGLNKTETEASPRYARVPAEILKSVSIFDIMN